jgi:hypothetical protein
MSETSDDRQPKIYHSKPLRLDIKSLENKFYRADIELIDVDHSGPSYEGRVFINEPDANHSTPKNIENGYVGSYYIFGHGGCFGDIGHCDRRDWRPYDYRLPDPLRPAYIPLTITEYFRKIGRDTDTFTITIVPILARKNRKYEVDMDKVVKMKKVAIITYD